MTWNLVASTKVASGGNFAVTTSAINCLGADLIVAEVTSNNIGFFTDSTGLNTWTQIGNFTGGAASTSLFYCLGPHVSATQTFSYSGGYSTINLTAWSGSMGSGSADQTNDAIGTGVTTLAAGSITPSFNGSLIIAGLGTDGGSGQAIDTGTIQENTPFSNSLNEGGAIASYVQAVAAPINPTWSWTGSNAVAIVASFPPAPPPSTTTTQDFGNGFKITNASATQGPFSLVGGEYGVTVHTGTWNGATVALSVLGPDGTTYVAVANATTFTADNFGSVYLPPGLYQMTVSAAVPTNVNFQVSPIKNRR